MHRAGQVIAPKELGQAIATVDFENWFKCRKVELLDSILYWELDLGSRYSFARAYRKAPHWQLIAAQEEEEIIKWIKEWGPLQTFLTSENGQCTLDEIHQLQFDLAWWAYMFGLMQDCGTSISRKMRERFVYLFQEGSEENTRAAYELIREHCEESPVTAAITAHLTTAGDGKLIQFLDKFIRFYPQLKFGHRLGFGKKSCRKRLMLFARNECFGLVEALQWMLYLDVLRGQEIRFCIKCGGLVDPRSGKKKFDSLICQKRYHDRKNKESRRAREKEEPCREHPSGEIRILARRAPVVPRCG
jgi:hypothetical protein